MVNWSRSRLGIADRWKNLANVGPASLAALTIFLLLVLGCRKSSPEVSPEHISPELATPDVIRGDGVAPSRPSDAIDQTSIRKVILLQNQGGSMEGHTPRGFRGMGTGLFAGDNLNQRFPDGDGVQLFLTFDLNGRNCCRLKKTGHDQYPIFGQRVLALGTEIGIIQGVGCKVDQVG